MKEAREPLLLVGICIDWAPWENQPYQQLAHEDAVPYQWEILPCSSGVFRMYWSYNWASLAANTCSRLKQGDAWGINPEISMSSWKFPGESPDPIRCWLLWMYFTACQSKSVGKHSQALLVPHLMCNGKARHKVPSTWSSQENHTQSPFLELSGPALFWTPLQSCFPRSFSVYLYWIIALILSCDYLISWNSWVLRLVTLKFF